MERSKILLWVLVFAAAGIIVWRVGFSGPEPYLPPMTQTAEAAGQEAGDPNTATEEQEADAAEPNAVSDANQVAEEATPDANDEPDQTAARERARGRRIEVEPAEGESADPNASKESDDGMEAVNLKDVEMKKIIDKIASWTGKTVIPHEDAMKQKITIYAPDKLPRAKALATIYSALRLKGFVVEEDDDIIFLKPIADAKLGTVPTVGPDDPLALIENHDQISAQVLPAQELSCNADG